MRRRSVLVICAGLLLAAAVAADELPRPLPQPSALGAKATLGRFTFAGQPSADGLRQAAEAGFGLVINLRTQPEVEELPFDEPALASELGMRYLPLPFSGEAFGADHVRRFAAVVAESEDGEGKVLLHCGSSNRVGALWAGYLLLEKGLSVEEALEHGRAAGLRSAALEAKVRRMADDRPP